MEVRGRTRDWKSELEENGPVEWEREKFGKSEKKDVDAKREKMKAFASGV